MHCREMHNKVYIVLGEMNRKTAGKNDLYPKRLILKSLIINDCIGSDGESVVKPKDGMARIFYSGYNAVNWETQLTVKLISSRQPSAFQHIQVVYYILFWAI